MTATSPRRECGWPDRVARAKSRSHRPGEASMSDQPSRTGARRTRDRTAPPRSARPTELSRRSWWGVLKRTVKEFQEDNLTDWAASLTYYAVLSIFPALLAVVSLLGLFGQSATRTTHRQPQRPGPRPRPADHRRRAQRSAEQPARRRNRDRHRHRRRPVVGIKLRGGVHQGGQRHVRDAGGPPVWKTLPLRLAITTVLVILMAAGAGGRGRVHRRPGRPGRKTPRHRPDRHSPSGASPSGPSW